MKQSLVQHLEAQPELDNTFKGLALGSKRSAGWFHFQIVGQSNDPIQRAVLVESPIDAMSFAVAQFGTQDAKGY